MQKAKEESLGKRVKGIQKHLFWWAVVWPAFDVMRGEVPSARGVMAGAGLNIAITKLLQKPAVVDFLTNATDKDVQAIPPELRGKFPSILNDAQTHGVNVSPALRRAFVGAAALAPNATDSWQNQQP